MKILFRTLFLVSAVLTSYYLGTLTAKAKEFTPLCATFAEQNMELEISAMYAISSSNQILGMATSESVAEMQKDSRLVFHVCPK